MQVFQYSLTYFRSPVRFTPRSRSYIRGAVHYIIYFNHLLGNFTSDLTSHINMGATILGKTKEPLAPKAPVKVSPVKSAALDTPVTVEYSYQELLRRMKEEILEEVKPSLMPKLRERCNHHWLVHSLQRGGLLVSSSGAI